MINKEILKRDASWLLMIIASFGMFLGAIFYQYVFDMKPCYMCIQQRGAVFYIGLASFVGYILHTHTIEKKRLSISCMLFLLLLSGIVVSFWGGQVAYQHLSLAENPMSFLFSTCGSSSPFGKFLALDEWWPAVFEINGVCSSNIAKALGVKMPVFVLVLCGGAVIHFTTVLVKLSLQIKRRF